MVYVQVRKEFPDMRQNERRINFIRVSRGGVMVVRVTAGTTGQLPDSHGEQTLNVGPWFVFIARGQGVV